MQRIVITLSLLTLIASVPGSAQAQLNGNRGSTGSSGGGGFGSSSLGGGSSFGGGGLGSSGLGGGMGSGGLGGGGMGSMGGGGMGGGMNGMGGGGLGGGQNQNALLGTNPNQFIGGNGGNQGNGRNGQMNMNGGMMNQMGNNRGRAGGGRNNLESLNSMMNNGGNFGGNNNNGVAPIRPRQRVAFEYPVPKGEILHTTLQTHLTRVAIRNPALSSVQLTTNPGGEIVVRGAVKSEADAKLAVNLLRLEPGVRTVRSELTFPAADAKSATE